MSDDFFSRWSRRKREVRGTEQAKPISPDAANDKPQSPDGLCAPETDQAAPELSPEDLAALPALDALTPDTDLTGFLQKGVPAALRNAALRRMWSLDPAVRNYVGDARDYAWDWNAPGGVPGFGPLAPTDEVYATLDEMFTRPETAEAASDDTSVSARSPERSVAPRADARAPTQAPEPAPESAALSAQEHLTPEQRREADGASEAAVPAVEAAHAAINPQPPLADVQKPEPIPLRQRRHGGATPH